MNDKQAPALPDEQPPAEQEEKPMKFAVERFANSRKYQAYHKKAEQPEE